MTTTPTPEGDRFAIIDERFDRVDERFVTIDERFDRVDERFVTIDERFDRIEERLERLEQTITQSLEDSERSRQALREEVERWDERFFQFTRDNLNTSRAIIITAGSVVVLSPVLQAFAPAIQTVVSPLVGAPTP